MQTFAEISKAVAEARETASWHKGEEKTEADITKMLKGFWYVIKSTLDPSKAGIPVSCATQPTTEGLRVIGKHVFVTTKDTVVTYGFDVVATIGDINEQVTVSFTRTETDKPNSFAWNIQVDSALLQETPLCYGAVPLLGIKDANVARLAIDKLGQKLVAKASS